MVVVVLHIVTVPLVYALVSLPFMEHDQHGVGIEPRWAGHLAWYADAAVLSALAGSIFGNLKGVRPGHVLAVGISSALLRAAIQYGDDTLRGYPPDELESVLFGVGNLLLCFVPLMWFLEREPRACETATSPDRLRGFTVE